MAFVVFKGETKLADIVERAYGTKLSAAERTRAVAAIERANPHLLSVKKPERGTLVLVPRVPGLAPAAERPEQDPVVAGASEIADALRRYRKTLESSLAPAKARSEEVLKLLSAKELREAVAAGTGGAAQLDGIAEATKERQSAHARTEAALDDIEKAADELADLGGRLR